MSTTLQEISKEIKQLSKIEHLLLFNKHRCLRVLDRLDFIYFALQEKDSEFLEKNIKILKDLSRQISKAKLLIIEHTQEKNWINKIVQLTTDKKVFERQNALLFRRIMNLDLTLSEEWGKLPIDNTDEKYDFLFVKNYVENLLKNEKYYQKFYEKYQNSEAQSKDIDAPTLKEDIESTLRDIIDLRPKDDIKDDMKLFKFSELQNPSPILTNNTWKYSSCQLNEKEVIVKQPINKKNRMDDKIEAFRLNYLEHPNILPLYGVTFETEYSLILNLDNGISLTKLIDSQNYSLKFSTLLQIGLQIAEGMNYLHCNDIYCGLINPQEIILIEKDEKLIPVICGIQILKKKFEITLFEQPHFLISYYSPESTRNEIFNFSTDVYSFGILFWELITGKKAFSEINNSKIIRNHFLISKNNKNIKEIRPELTMINDNNLKELLSDCWNEKPKLRPTFRKIIQRLKRIIENLKESKPELFDKKEPSLTKLRSDFFVSLFDNYERQSSQFYSPFSQSIITHENNTNTNDNDNVNDDENNYDLNTTRRSSSSGGNNGISKIICVGKEKECKTIGEALVKARSGDRIEIYPGIYNEQLVITTDDLEIIGIQNEKHGILIEHAAGSILSFQAQKGNISNITFRYLGQKFFTVEIISGIMEMNNCDISGLGAACLGISRGAEPKIKECLIHHGKVGIAIFNKGNGLFHHCNIFENKYQGICITGNSKATIQNSKIYLNEDYGIQVKESSKGAIRGCDIFYNKLNGVEIESKSLPKFENCNIFENQGHGIFLSDVLRPKLSNNRIYLNKKSGITCKSSSPQTFHNEIFQNSELGIFLNKQSKGEFIGNKIYNNKLAGVQIQDKSDPIFDDNSIFKNTGSAFIARDHSLGSITNNLIYENDRSGIDVESSSDPKFMKNKIYKNLIGVLISFKGKGKFVQNEIFQNKNLQFRIMKNCFPILQNNKIPLGVKNDNNN
ncbi:f-box only protein [Anaeramoeba flamelloides]|uniref:F-box only protein n=1 Tax=Anaeramoeba flamelloides TaxID=1746091 RepID=A0ABQ8ZAF4_9EUKA|nr:f-box only protein [Anaeramoeba flamelloides]